MDVREKLVELSDIQVLQREMECVKRKSATNCTDCLNCDLLMTDERILTAYKNAIDALQNAHGVTVQEWISVKDRLPEDDDSIHFYGDGRMRCTTVLAYTEYGRIIPKNRLIVKPTGNEYLDTQVTDGWEWARGTEEVTHWMPLPQPPKGE